MLRVDARRLLISS